MKSGIYQIYNKVNDKRYIGQAVNIDKRLKNHIHELKNNIHINVFLQKDFNQYGEDNFIFEPLKIIDEEFLNVMERYFIDKYNTTNNGYNISSGNRTLSKTVKKQLETEKLENEFENLSKVQLDIEKNDLILYEFRLQLNSFIDYFNDKHEIDIRYCDYLDSISSCHYVNWISKYNKKFEKIIMDCLKKFDSIISVSIYGNSFDTGIHYDYLDKCPYFVLNYILKNKNDEEIFEKKIEIEFIPNEK